MTREAHNKNQTTTNKTQTYSVFSRYPAVAPHIVLVTIDICAYKLPPLVVSSPYHRSRQKYSGCSAGLSF